jgi:hypothetical protein
MENLDPAPQTMPLCWCHHRIDTSELKAKRKTRLEKDILKRARKGLPPSRWQQMELHFRTACRQGWRQNPRKMFFYFKSVLRGLFCRH